MTSPAGFGEATLFVARALLASLVKNRRSQTVDVSGPRNTDFGELLAQASVTASGCRAAEGQSRPTGVPQGCAAQVPQHRCVYLWAALDGAGSNLATAIRTIVVLGGTFAMVL